MSDINADPLEIWMERLTALKSDTKAILPKLKRCCTIFQFDPRYKNDSRYVHLCITLADASENPLLTFENFYKKDIGKHLAIFWSAWALTTYLKGDKIRAREILVEGLSVGAEPRKYLDEIQHELNLAPLNQEQEQKHEFKRKRMNQEEISRPDIPLFSQSVRIPFQLINDNKIERNSLECTPKTKRQQTINDANRCCHSIDLEEVKSTPIHPFRETHRADILKRSSCFIEWERNAIGTKIFDYKNNSLHKWPKKVVQVRQPSVKRFRKHFKNVVEYCLGHQRIVIEGELGSGAYASVFNCRLCDSGELCAIKLERPSSSLTWEYYICEQFKMRYLESQKTNSSNRKCEPEESKDIVFFCPDRLFRFSDGSALMMKMGTNGTLHDLAAAYMRSGQSVPELTVAYYGAEMARFIKELHGCGILHCDVKPDNWLLSMRTNIGNMSKFEFNSKLSDHEFILMHSVTLIDFGRSIDRMNYPQNQKFICGSHQAAKGFGCPQMLQKIPWTYHFDLWGFASSLHYLLFSENLPIFKNERTNRYCSPKHFRRYWHVDEWERVFDLLLNEDSESSASTLSIVKQILFKVALGDSNSQNELKEQIRTQKNILTGV